mgnify:CR=1 FL=1
MCGAVAQYCALAIANGHHSDILVWTGVCAGGTANTACIVYLDYTVERTVNCAGWTTNHADRVLALQAGISNHNIVVNWPMANETWIVVVAVGTCTHTFVAARTTV